MPSPSRSRRAAIAVGCLVLLAAAALGGAATARAAVAHAVPVLRVCADPNNRPFSAEDGSGMENKIAELIGQELGADVTYTWFAQRRGFLRNTLNAGKCDLVPRHSSENGDAADDATLLSLGLYVRAAGDDAEN